MTEFVKTMDGSFTLKSERFGEFYHSFTGAEEESELKYVGPCNIRERAKKGELHILDFCFGIGYNTAAAIDAAIDENPDCKIIVVGLELDEALFDSIQKLNPSWKSYSLIKGLTHDNHFVAEGNVSIQLIMGDAAEKILEVEGSFDCVFFDPFSPKTCGDLWSEKIFTEVLSRMKPGSVLATYSCARMVRENLKSAGFSVVEDGPKVQRRGPGTIAKP